MSKIVYLIEQPLDGRNHNRFGLRTWSARGWDVEVWDLTPLAYPRAWQGFIDSGRELSRFEGYYPVATQRQLNDRFSRLHKVEYFVDLTGDSYHPIRAKMRLMRAGARRIVCTAGSMPDMGEEAEQKGGLAHKLMQLFAQSPGRAFDWLRNALVSRLAAPFIRPGLSIVSGENSLRASLDAGRAHEILKAHNLDYDIFLQLNQSGGAQQGGFGVFLDQNICFAPDFIYENVAPYVTAEQYFPVLCNGLRKMAAVCGVPLRIAAHPRLPRQKEYLEYFQGMPLEYGRTAELIRDCSFVVCHYSTAIQFAVLFGKPVIFVTTDQLNASAAGKYIARFAAALGKPVINLDADLERLDWQSELRIDSRDYAEYRRQYIKTDGSPETPYWDIVANHVEDASGRVSGDRSIAPTTVM